MINVDASAVEGIFTPLDFENYISSLTDATLPLLGERTSTELILSAMDRIDGVLTAAKSHRLIDDFTLDFNLEQSLEAERGLVFDIGITAIPSVPPEKHAWCIEKMIDVCNLAARNPDTVEPYARLLFEKIIELASNM